MAGIANWLDFAAMITAVSPFDPVNVVAGDGNDGVEQNGFVIDRFTLGQNQATDLRRRGLGAALFIFCTATLGHNESVTLIANLQHGDNFAFNVNVSDFPHRASAQPPIIPLPTLTIDEQEATTYGVLKQQYDLTGARRYLRVQYTVTLTDSTHTDNAMMSGALVFGGAQHGPFEGGLVGSYAAQNNF